VGTTSARGTSAWAQRWHRLPEHFSNVLNYHTTLPFLGLTALGMLLSVVKRDSKTVFFWLFIIATFLFFSYVIHKNERYTIFWLPAFSVFAAYPLFLLREKNYAQYAAGFVLSLVFAYQVYAVYKEAPNYATGYPAAAQFVLDNSNSPTVFIDAYNNGYFTYYMRAQDDARSMYVLRADKLLASSSISARNKLELHAQNREDILEILGKYGIELIVVESRDVSGIPIYKEFRELLKEGPFSLVKRIPVESTRPVLYHQELLIYRYLERKPISGDTLTLHLPVVGQTINVPIRKLITDGEKPD
jgi:hypothetical protein